MKFQLEHGRSWKSQKEYSKRLSIFSENKKKIEKHNKDRKDPDDVELKMNDFGDWTVAEFSAILGTRHDTEDIDEVGEEEDEEVEANLLAEVR